MLACKHFLTPLLSFWRSVRLCSKSETIVTSLFLLFFINQYLEDKYTSIIHYMGTISSCNRFISGRNTQTSPLEAHKSTPSKPSKSFSFSFYVCRVLLP